MSDEKHKGQFPQISSSYRVWAGSVDEITWTPEDEVLKKWGLSQQDYVTRHKLREMGRNGIITTRRNPEHGFHEYGPQWRSKDFENNLHAAIAANMLRGGGDE